MSERGAAGVPILVLVLLGLLLSAALVDLSHVLVARVRAQLAADAAALASAPVTFAPFGAAGSAGDEAARFARANGARLVSCRCRHDPSRDKRTVVVTTEVEASTVLFGSWSVTATGRAEFDPSRLRSLE